MASTLRKLTLIAPRDLEAAVTDCLLALPAPLDFTVIESRGRGASMTLASAAERVRGAMRTIMVVSVLEQDRIASILEAVAQACPVPRLSYWVEPVEDFGRLGESP